MMRSKYGRRDVIDSAVVDAIDRLASSAPGVTNWWEDLVLPARALRKEYNECVPYPEIWRPLRPYAYLPFFAPRYLPRFRHILRAAGLQLDSLLKLKRDPIRILDLGAGTGILTIASLLELEASSSRSNQTTDVEVVLCDNDHDSLLVAQNFLRLLEEYNSWPHLRLTWTPYQSSIFDVADCGPFDFVLLGHVICESYQCSPAKLAQTENFFGPLLNPLFSAFKSSLSNCGIVVIIEPVNLKHVSTPLWLRNYVRSNSGLTLLAPCLGVRQECPELRAPYSGRAACSGSTHVITWNAATSAGRRLRLFAQAALLLRGDTRSLPLSPSYFFPLVLSMGKRNQVPTGIGMAVRRLGPPEKTLGVQPVCVVGANGEEYIAGFVKERCNGRRSVLGAVDVRRSKQANLVGFRPEPVDFDLSALYSKGWPVAL